MNAVEIEVDVVAEMRDGVVLRADVYRPGGSGPWPVLVQRTPYGKSSPLNYNQLAPIEAAQRGYMVVHQDTRGTGASDGAWLPFHSEREDGFDTVEWAARLPGSDGRVGMIGSSYTGSTQWSAAITRPPSLRAIAPMVTWSDPSDGVLFRGGATELGLNLMWTLSQSLGQVHKAAASPEAAAAAVSALLDAMDHAADRTYWELPSGAQPSVVAAGQPDIGVAAALRDPASAGVLTVVGHHGDISTPSLVVSGWYDLFQQGALNNHVATCATGGVSHLVVGPWHHYSLYGAAGGHTGGVNFGSGSLIPPGHASLTGIQLNWYDRWLKDLPATDLHRPGVELFVMGSNVWRSEPEWPLTRAVDTELFLHDGGAAAFGAPGMVEASSPYIHDPLDPVPTCGGAMLMANEFPPGPFDQRSVEARADVLTFTTEPLTSDLEVTGRVRAVLFVQTDAPTTDWVVRLCDVHEDGTSINIVDGIVRRRVTAGSVDEVEVDLWSTSMLFRTGHRLRVHVASSSFPRWDRNLGSAGPVTASTESRTANQVLHHDVVRPSRVILPVVPS